MFGEMRKRVNSQNSHQEAEPLVATDQTNATAQAQHTLKSGTANAGILNHIALFLYKARGYRGKEICKLVMVSLTVFMLLSCSLGLILSKTGVAYKIDGKTKILSTQEIMSSHTKGINVSKEKSFAVVINTFKRPDMLKTALNHWVNNCGVEANISQVFIVWAELDKTPPKPEDIIPEFETNDNLRKTEKSRSKSQKMPSVQFIRVPKDSLNSRFLPIKNLKTDAVFMVDDDVRIDCESMKSSFEAWRHYPDALVGFYPRLAAPKQGFFTSKANMIYHTWPIVYAKQSFNIILTKASFFDQKYLAMYHNDEDNPKEILDYIDKNKNCEDIAMAFLVARKTGHSSKNKNGYCPECPVYTKGKIKDEGLFNGISTSGGSLAPQGHMEKRSLCLDELTRIYEKRGWDYPLFDVNLSEQSWKHVIWWQNKPSSFFEWFSIGNTLL